MMFTRHLATGSELPAVVKDRLRLYSMRFCPYVQRTKLVLEHKNIPHEVVYVNLKNKPDWLFERNPLGLVPIIEYKGHVIYESAVCDEFLEDLFPASETSKDVPLMPRCAFDRATARLLMQTFDKLNQKFFALLRDGDAVEKQERLKAFQTSYDKLETILSKTGNTFFGGVNVGMVDFHMWPFFERFDAVSELGGIDPLPVDRFPRLTAWRQAMLGVEAVKKTRLSTELHKRFLVSYRDGNPEYDIELDDVEKIGDCPPPKM